MTIRIDLPPDVEEAVRTQAAQDGLPIEAYVTSLVQEGTKSLGRTHLKFLK
jgi:hypothetical protein